MIEKLLTVHAGKCMVLGEGIMTEEEIIEMLKSRLRLEIQDVTQYTGPLEFAIRLMWDDTKISEDTFTPDGFDVSY